ncbi:MAG: NADH-quinone oxidoreductase subunit L, partial [SAR324 cluster bacterium]|nr:NADH-quinone oxidoreductase subunit L [SAR324 cluster bacterium]
MGIPPFGGFFSKYMVMSGGVASTPMYVWLIFLFGAFLTILYLFRVFSMVFLGSPKKSSDTLPKEGGRLMVYCVAALAALSLLSGLLFQFPLEFVESAVMQMLEV